MKKSVFVVTALAVIGFSQLSGPAPALAQGGGCMAEFNSKLADFQTQYPMKSSWGARDTYQYAYFFGENALNILMNYQSCLNSADFAANFQALTGMRDNGRSGCQQLNSGVSACTATYPAS